MSQKVTGPQKHSGGGITAIFVSSIGSWHVPRVGEEVGEEGGGGSGRGKSSSENYRERRLSSLLWLSDKPHAEGSREVGDLRPKPGRVEGGLTVAGGRQRKGIPSRRTMAFGFHHVELETLRRWQQNIYQDPGSMCANIELTFAGDMCWSWGRGGQTGRGSPSPVNKVVWGFGLQRHCTNCLISESLQIRGPGRACPVLLLVSNFRVLQGRERIQGSTLYLILPITKNKYSSKTGVWVVWRQNPSLSFQQSTQNGANRKPSSFYFLRL